MTCIAWDGTTLAADKRATNNGGLARTCTKIERFADKLLAMTGDWDEAIETREWFKAGADPAKFPESVRKGDRSSLLVIDAVGNIWHYTKGPYPMEVEDKQMAWGSGRDFALAAMHLGKDAIYAVEVACVFQTDCGSGIDALELDVKEAPF